MAQTIRPRLARRLRPAPGRLSRLARESWLGLERGWRHDPKRLLWLALWSPFWIGSDAPRPARPGAPPEIASANPLTPAGAWLVERVDRVTRWFRIGWIAGSILRGIALALAVLAIWAVVAVFTDLGLPGWIVAAAVLGAGIAIGALYGWLARPSRLMLARMLDRTFQIDERMVTAFDRQVDATYVSRLQLADAANTFDDVMADVPRSTYLPVREAALCLIAAGALVTAVLANVPSDPIDPVGPPPVPAFVPASERLAVRESPLPQRTDRDQPQAEQASLSEIQEQSRVAQDARDDLATLGEALEHHPVTQPAAGSIAAGNYPDAAESLRAAAGAASTLSQGERDALADQLEAAAEAIGETNPDLARAAREAADALREGGPVAEQALNNLADQIDQTGSEAQSQAGAPANLDESNPGSDSGASPGQGEQGAEGSGAPESGDGGAAIDPGAGVDAAPGVTSGPQDQQASGSAEGGSETGGAAEGGGDAPEPGQGNSPGEAGGDGASAGGESGGAQQGMTGAPNEETNASQGSGAGTGQTGANDQSNSEGSVDAPAPPEEPDADTEVPSAGEAGDPPPSRAARGEEDDGTGSSSGGGQSLQLSGVSDQNVPSGGSSGSSSLGSGSGSSTSSGSESAGTVGLAGPDSNSVPDSLRDIVQGYFDGPRP